MTTTTSLHGQVALITGASRGIGACLARTLASHGVNLALAARTVKDLEALAQEITAAHPDVQVLTVAFDARDPLQAETLIQKTLARFGQLDILLNNAGVASKVALLHEVSIADIDRTIDTNLKGPLYLMKYALPPMIARQTGTIINLNSVAGKTAYPYWSIYDASKFGLHAATVAAGEEQRNNGIRVVGIYPGAVDTPIWETLELNHEPNKAGMLRPEDVANAVLYILQQPQSVYIPEVVISPLVPAL